MRSQYVTDDVGNRLRATYFPFQVDKTVPPPTAGFGVRSKSKDKLAPMSPYCKQLGKQPSTLMVVDYNQDQQYLKEIVENGPFETSEMNRSSQRNRLTIRPTQLKQQLPHPALPLRSAFVLKQKVDMSTPELEMSVSQQLFNKQDAVTQTETPLLRHNFKGVTDYNEWSNSVAEPFFKVSKLSYMIAILILPRFCQELRKAVRTNRPQDLSAYIVAYCNALQRGDDIPLTVDP